MNKVQGAVLIQLSHHIIGGTTQNRRVGPRQDKMPEAMTESLQFSKGFKRVLCGPKDRVHKDSDFD